jgi:hypothetical protein
MEAASLRQLGEQYECDGVLRASHVSESWHEQRNRAMKAQRTSTRPTVESTDGSDPNGNPATHLARDESRDQLLQRIRESLNWLRRTPTRTSAPYQKAEPNIRDSIRQLSRQRVSSLLRQLRSSHALSYEQVAERTGLPQQLLFDVEFKDRRLSLEELRRLAICYGVSVDDLLGIDVE